MDDFDSPFAKKYLDAGPADAIRALRPGGPLDTTMLQTRCLKCGTEINQPLRWFHNRDFACSCGGQFDTKPLTNAVAELVTNYQIATKTPEELLQFLKDAEAEQE